MNSNGVTVSKSSIWVKIGDFCPKWPRNLTDNLKTIGHLSYTTSSVVHHLIAICQFKLELQSRKAQFVSKSTIFCPAWPWNLMDDLENNRVPLRGHIKLCASFHRHQWIQTAVTFRKRWIMVKIDEFCPVWPWNLTDNLEKETKGHNY